MRRIQKFVPTQTQLQANTFNNLLKHKGFSNDAVSVIPTVHGKLILRLNVKMTTIDQRDDIQDLFKLFKAQQNR